MHATDTDFLIIGAGFAGLVTAERLSSAGWRCVVADQVTAMALVESDKLLKQYPHHPAP